MENLLILGEDSSTSYAIAYAKGKKIHTIVTDYKSLEKSHVKQMADEFWMIDVKDLDNLEKRCREQKITGIYAGNSEFCLDHAKELCRRLDLPFYASDEGWLAAREKAVFKQACLDSGLQVPPLYATQDNYRSVDTGKIKFPLIVKPVDRCAQIGQTRCEKPEEFLPAFEKALASSFTGKAFAEEYIDGIETDGFFLIADGHAELLYLSDKYNMTVDEKWKCSFQPAQSRFEAQYRKQVVPCVTRLAGKLHMTDGPLCLQSIWRDGSFYVLEMCYRIDGIGSWVNTKKMFGISNIEWAVDFAMGRKHSAEEFRNYDFSRPAGCAATYLFWSEGGTICEIKGLEEIRKNPDLEIVFQRYRIGDYVPADGTMMQMPYYISVCADSMNAVAEDMCLINRTLHHMDENGREMLVPYTDFSGYLLSGEPQKE